MEGMGNIVCVYDYYILSGGIEEGYVKKTFNLLMNTPMTIMCRCISVNAVYHAILFNKLMAEIKAKRRPAMAKHICAKW